MVEFEEMEEETPNSNENEKKEASTQAEATEATATATTAVSLSDERIADAVAIEEAAASMTRPSAKMHLEALAKKLRKEGAALKRVEESRAKVEQKNQQQQQQSSSSSSSTSKSSDAATASEATSAPVPVAAAPKKTAPPPPPPPTSGAQYTSIDTFSFDSGSYGSAHVSVYVSLPGVGALPRDQITCDFTSGSFDLIVRGLGNKSYRLFKENLDKDIDPTTSKIIVKSNKVIVKLGKVKSEYGSYDYWTDLTSKKSKKKSDSKKDDPSASIMELMKDMYESGDDNMKKMIGETMMKQRTGQLDRDGPPGLDDDLGRM